MKQHTSNSDKREYWKTQMALAKKFPGPVTEFCKANNLSFHTFCYWRQKFNQESQNTPTVLQRPFVAVNLEKAVPPKKSGTLPDPKWVAELIFHLQAGL